jgi:hypothetical protein
MSLEKKTGSAFKDIQGLETNLLSDQLNTGTEREKTCLVTGIEMYLLPFPNAGRTKSISTNHFPQVFYQALCPPDGKQFTHLLRDQNT